MIWRSDDQREAYCDIGPHAGKWRIAGYLYGSREEIDALLSSRTSAVVVVPDPGDGGYISGAMSNPRRDRAQQSRRSDGEDQS